MLQSIWVVFKEPLMAGVFGIFVGFFNHARKNKRRILLPRRLKNSWDLGFIYDCMESALGAFALVLAIAPSGWIRVIFVALLGALNGEQVFYYLLTQFHELTENSINKALEKEIKPTSEDNKEVK